MPSPTPLVGEKEFEDFAEGLFIHAAARVSHAQECVTARLGPGVGLAILLINPHILRLDGNLAAGGHGVAGVDAEVHQDLLDLSRIGTDDPQVMTGKEVECDVLTDHASDHLHQVGDHVVQVDIFHLEHLPPAEGQ